MKKETVTRAQVSMTLLMDNVIWLRSVLTNKLEKSRFVFSWFDMTEPTFSPSLHQLDTFGEVGAEQSRFVPLDLKGDILLSTMIVLVGFS